MAKKRFNGKSYDWAMDASKRSCLSHARKLRKDGYNARVVKEDGYHSVYRTRKKRKR